MPVGRVTPRLQSCHDRLRSRVICENCSSRDTKSMGDFGIFQGHNTVIDVRTSSSILGLAYGNEWPGLSTRPPRPPQAPMATVKWYYFT